MRVLRILFFLFMPWFLMAARFNPDSLRKVWSDPAKPDTLRNFAMMTYAMTYIYVQPDTAFLYASKVHEISLRKSLGRWIPESSMSMALACYVKGDYDKALQIYDVCIAELKDLQSKESNTASRYETMLGLLYNNIGNVYFDRGDNPKALDYYFRSLKVVEKMNDLGGQATSLGNIGIIYAIQKNYDQAIIFLLKSLKLEKESGHEKYSGSTLNNIGNIYLEKGEFEKAAEYQYKSLEARKAVSDKVGIASSYASLANISFKQGQVMEKSGEKELAATTFYPKALEYYLESYKIMKEIGDKRGLAELACNVGSALNELGREKEALSYCKEALEISVEIKTLNEEKAACKCLYDSYKVLNNTNEALKYYENFIRIRDTLNSEERIRDITQKQFEFAYAKRAAADSVKVAGEKFIIEAKLEKEETKRYALYGGLALVIIFAGIMVNRFKVSQNQRKLIDAQKKLVEAKQKEVLDSIHYAKRIQHSLMPTEKYIERNLKK
jgi:tetratricopeptide (TPR) repeat protein